MLNWRCIPFLLQSLDKVLSRLGIVADDMEPAREFLLVKVVIVLDPIAYMEDYWFRHLVSGIRVAQIALPNLSSQDLSYSCR